MRTREATHTLHPIVSFRARNKFFKQILATASEIITRTLSIIQSWALRWYVLVRWTYVTHCGTHNTVDIHSVTIRRRNQDHQVIRRAALTIYNGWRQSEHCLSSTIPSDSKDSDRVNMTIRCSSVHLWPSQAIVFKYDLLMLRSTQKSARFAERRSIDRSWAATIVRLIILAARTDVCWDRYLSHYLGSQSSIS